MSIETFIKAAREYDEEIDDYFKARPELIVALTNDAVAIDTLFAVVPSLAALLDKYGLLTKFREQFEQKKQPSSIRLLAQVFGHPWHHLNLEQILAGAIRSTQSLDPECDKKGSCGDCDCGEKDGEPISVGLTPEGDLAYIVSDAPLTLQEEAQFIDTLRGNTFDIPVTEEEGKVWESLDAYLEATKTEESKVAQHDAVNHPSHYTSNASGVEAIELTEKMSFNLGNAFKYVFRRDGKANTLQDVCKAEWYLKREIGRLEALIETLPASSLIFMHPSMALADLRKADKVIAAETNLYAADFFAYLFTQGPIQEPEDLQSLHDALESLQRLIEEIRNSQS